MTVQTHAEPFVHLVDVTSDSALVAWGAFWFERASPDEPWRTLEGERLREATGRSTLIGHRAEPYGESLVEVLDEDGAVVAQARTDDRTWVRLAGLQPSTAYAYRVVVDGEPWAEGERWDWVPTGRGGYDLQPAGRSYDLRFTTHPAADEPAPLVFAVLGDYGVGIASDSESSRRQRRIAEVVDRLVHEHGARFVVTTGDNVYDGERGRGSDGSGGSDADWWSSFYAPYRYVLSRVPFYPAVGNHDTSDSEQSDDRDQLYDNFHTAERFRGDDALSSVGRGLHYVLRWGADIELVEVDSSEASSLDAHRHFQDPEHLDWLRGVFGRPGPRWRIPFSHHPVFCAGPHHGNDEEMLQTLVPLYRQGGVKAVLAGHEHNFQLSQDDGITYVLTGAGGNLREDLPEDLEAARTTAYAVQAHAVLGEIAGDELRLTPVAGLHSDGSLHRMTALSPDGAVLVPPFVVRC